jgi:serine/threonine-protein kinase
VGEIYQAWDSGLDRIVAIKLINSDFSNDTAFRAQVMSSFAGIRDLAHPSIAKVHAVEEVAGNLLIIMEYIQGTNLADLARQHRLDNEQFMELALRVSGGLGYAHDHNLSHKNITSANLMIGSDGLPKLLDFGMGPTSDMMRPENYIFPPQRLQYMPPEQIKGRTAAYTSDLYSLGVVFYEILSGKLPYRGETPDELMEAIQQGRPDLEPLQNCGLPGNTVLMVKKLMSPSPDDRFLNAGELRITLDGILSFERTTAQTFGVRKRSRISPKIYIASSLAFFLLVILWLVVSSID